MIAGSLSVGFSFVYARKFVSPLGPSPLALTTYQMGFALLILLAPTDRQGVFEVLHDTRASVGLIVGLGLAGRPCLYAYYLIVDRLGAIAASRVTYIPPVVALFIGVALVGEPVLLIDAVATAAILAEVGILQSGRSLRSGGA